MKTYDGGKSNVPCSNCPPGTQLAHIAESIKQACTFLADGHAGVSNMYKALAMLPDVSQENKEILLKEAEKHDRLAQETGRVILPVGRKEGA